MAEQLQVGTRVRLLLNTGGPYKMLHAGTKGTVVELPIGFPVPLNGWIGSVRVRWDGNNDDELRWSAISALEPLTALDLIAEELERADAADCK